MGGFLLTSNNGNAYNEAMNAREYLTKSNVHSHTTYVDGRDNAEEMVRAVQNKTPTWYCAELNGIPAGTVAVWQEGSETHWGRFAVQPDLRGRGIGKALVRYSLEQSFSRGIDRICMEAREATVHIICKMGGRITGEAVPFFVGTVTPVEISAADFAKRSK